MFVINSAKEYVIPVARHRAIKIVVALNSFNKRIEKRIIMYRNENAMCICRIQLSDNFKCIII